MAPARRLLTVSSVIFAVVGSAYLIVPAAMLSIVGIASGATNEFLMRTEGVALLTAALMIWAARKGGAAVARIVLVALAGYFIIGSVVDLAAYLQGIVGTAAVPSVVIRIAFGAVCLLGAARLRATA